MPRAKVLPVPARPRPRRPWPPWHTSRTIACWSARRSDAPPGPPARPDGRPPPSARRSGRWHWRPAAARPPTAPGWTSGAPPGPVGDHADRPLGQEPVRQPLQLGPASAGQTSAEGDQDVGAGEGGRLGGQPLRAGQPVEQPTGHPADTVRSWTRSLSGRSPPEPGCPGPPLLGHLGPPPSIQGVRASCSLGLRVAWTAHLTSRGVRSRPSRPADRIQSIWPVRLEKPRTSASGSPELAVAVGVRGSPLHPECPESSRW